MGLNKDFYNNLPGMVCVILEEYVEKYSSKEGFSEAWDKYRKHVLESSMDDMMMPYSYFEEVIKESNNAKARQQA